MKKIILIITLLITLVACKSSNEIKIEFESNGSIVEIQYIKENSKVNKPIDPFKENYIFLYWELNNEEFDFNTLINEDIILKAKYKEDTHKVVFINDNVVLKEIDILHNNKVENIIINKEGYKFIGWLLNDEIFNFNTLINEDIILYALFEEEIVQYTVSFVIDEEINNILINKNNKVEQPIDPFKENYLFLYWELDNNEYDFNTLITKDIILIAKFIIKDPEIGTIYSDEFNNEYEVYDTNKLILNKVNENLEYINIPSELYGNTITKINNEVFLNNTIIKEIILPDTIEYIGNSILKGCTNLENLTIPFIGETISDNNFLGYFFGSSRYLDNIDYIEANLINVTITNIKELKRATFYQCNYIEKINLPNNLELIEEYAFYECYNLTNIIIPSEVVLIKASSFYHCTSLLTVTFNDDSKLEKIEEYAFSGCNSLLTIKLPDSVKEIERGIFYKCLNIISVNLSSNITVIPYAAFYECNSLKRIDLSNIKEINGYAFSRCYDLENIVLPEELELIEEYAFSNLHNLKTINIPNSITVISKGLFYYCTSLEKITLNENIITIEIDAFIGCDNLVIYSVLEQPKEDWYGFEYKIEENKYYYNNKEVIFNYLN